MIFQTMTQNSIIMMQTIEQMEDLQKSLKAVEEKLRESTKLVMFLLETPCELPQDFVGTLANALGLKIELSNSVKEESSIEINDCLPNEMMIQELVETKIEVDGVIEEQETVVAIQNKVVLKRREEWPTYIEPEKKKTGMFQEETSVLEVDLPPLKKKRKKDNGKEARKGYCEDCKRHYAVIKEHRRTVHDKITKTWTCPLCGLEIEYIHFGTCFNHKQECEARLTGIFDKYSCPGCDEKFPTVMLREHHKKVCLTKQGLIPKYVQAKPWICTYEGCDYRAHKKLNLQNHINKVHLKIPIEKNQFCDFCGQSFSHKDSLQKHVIKHHTNRRDYVCNICDGKFSTRNAFRQHMEIHSEVKKYLCPFCGKGFKQSSVLYRHKLTCKSNPEKFENKPLNIENVNMD